MAENAKLLAEFEVSELPLPFFLVWNTPTSKKYKNWIAWTDMTPGALELILDSILIKDESFWGVIFGVENGGDPLPTS